MHICSLHADARNIRGQTRQYDIWQNTYEGNQPVQIIERVLQWGGGQQYFRDALCQFIQALCPLGAVKNVAQVVRLIEAILIKRCGIYSSIVEFRQHHKTIDVGMVL